MRNILKAIFVVLVYLVLSGLIGVKSTYSINDQSKLLELAYFFIISGGYIYLVSYFYHDKKHKLLASFIFAIVVSYIPYETEYIRIVQLVNSPSENLSGLSAKMPIYFGILNDIFFFPVVIFCTLLLLFFIRKKKNK